MADYKSTAGSYVVMKTDRSDSLEIDERRRDSRHDARDGGRSGWAVARAGGVTTVLRGSRKPYG
jgi:hypothetical protein